MGHRRAESRIYGLRKLNFCKKPGRQLPVSDIDTDNCGGKGQALIERSFYASKRAKPHRVAAARFAKDRLPRDHRWQASPRSVVAPVAVILEDIAAQMLGHPLDAL